MFHHVLFQGLANPGTRRACATTKNSIDLSCNLCLLHHVVVWLVLSKYRLSDLHNFKECFSWPRRRRNPASSGELASESACYCRPHRRYAQGSGQGRLPCPSCCNGSGSGCLVLRVLGQFGHSRYLQFAVHGLAMKRQMSWLGPDDVDYGFFPPSETQCKCGCGLDIKDSLRDALNVLRGRVGGPLKVVSGARCEDYNRSVGGAPRSLHLVGYAADIAWPVTPAERHRLVVLASPVFSGLGFYENFVHLDLRHYEHRAPSLWVN